MKLKIKLSAAGKKTQRKRGKVKVTVMLKFIPSEPCRVEQLIETKRLTFKKKH